MFIIEMRKQLHACMHDREGYGTEAEGGERGTLGAQPPPLYPQPKPSSFYGHIN